jgi:hypothetical protein
MYIFHGETSQSNGGGSTISVVFRHVANNIRDFYELTSSPPHTQNKWAPSRVNTDDWYQQTCPMNGPVVMQACAPGLFLFCPFAIAIFSHNPTSSKI